MNLRDVLNFSFQSVFAVAFCSSSAPLYFVVVSFEISRKVGQKIVGSCVYGVGWALNEL